MPHSGCSPPINRPSTIFARFQIIELRMSAPPNLSMHASRVHLSISFLSEETKETCLYTAELPDLKNTVNAAGQLVIQLEQSMPLAGDVKVELFHKAKMMRKKQVLLRFWFNTHFANTMETTRHHTTTIRAGEGPTAHTELIDLLEFSLVKNEVDFVHKDKEHRVFPENFEVRESSCF